jgi:hypothetical protein
VSSGWVVMVEVCEAEMEVLVIRYNQAVVEQE